jgi:hypothetical protein
MASAFCAVKRKSENPLVAASLRHLGSSTCSEPRCRLVIHGVML